jgi:hypothetical protein
MNREELRKTLDKIGKQRINLYGIQGFNKYYLQHPPEEGEYILDRESGKWVVYQYKDGARVDEKTFTDEDQACHYFLEWIIGYHHLGTTK